MDGTPGPLTWALWAGPLDPSGLGPWPRATRIAPQFHNFKPPSNGGTAATAVGNIGGGNIESRLDLLIDKFTWTLAWGGGTHTAAAHTAAQNNSSGGGLGLS
ncbi:hypothetical protein THAOC_28468 [Thalassiosira oceanica]|uniref:Uncharacterized protein n=1 Tax=Thalassiosira oceanica TaxID=159749 RepID=K0RF06_THAOC|nr:hypothetical protein THAOC_28468 [Thalassiosira oceanica]|eukprot:EJK52278.1 hypothetical protein THAOC_28468 [Thalassiosira oceanica]